MRDEFRQGSFASVTDVTQRPLYARVARGLSKFWKEGVTCYMRDWRKLEHGAYFQGVLGVTFEMRCNFSLKAKNRDEIRPYAGDQPALRMPKGGFTPCI